MDDKMMEIDEAAIAEGGRTAHTATFIMLSKVLTIVIAGIGLVLMARILGPSSYGVYTFAVSAAGFFSAFGDFGIGIGIIKFTSEYIERKNQQKARSTVTTGLTLIIALGAVLTILSFLLAGVLSKYFLHSAAYTSVVQIAALTIIFGLLWSTSISIMIGLGMGKNYAAATAVQTTVHAATGIGLALLGYGPAAPIVGSITGFIFGAAVAFTMVSRRLGLGSANVGISSAMAKRVLGFSLPLGISGGIRTMIDNFAPVFLALFATTQVLGNVGIAIKVVGILDVITGSIGAALLPLFSSALSNRSGKKQIGNFYNYALYSSMLFAAPIVAYIVMLAQQFSYVVFGGVYTLAPLYIAIVCVGILANIVGIYTSQLMVGGSKIRQVTTYNIAVAAINLLMIFILVPTMGGLGMIIILFMVEPTVFALLVMHRVRAHVGTAPDFNKIFRVLAAAAVSALFILPLRYLIGMDFLPVLIVAFFEQLALYPIMLSLTGGISLKDIGILNRVVKGLPVVGPAVGIILSYSARFAK